MTTNSALDRTAVADPAPRLLPARHPSRWFSGGVVLALFAALILSLATNPKMQWNVVAEYVFAPNILNGLLNTLGLTVLCMAIAVALGVILAVMAMSGNVILQAVAAFYIWFFRGVPLIVQLIFWFNLALLWPKLGLIVNGVGFSFSTNDVISSFTASVLGLALHEAAYMAEIVRAGILTVSKGQSEAARALGMPETLAFRRVILPQAMRGIIPPTGNQLISLLKATSLVAFIAGGDLMTVVQGIYSVNFLVVPLLLVATFWYLLVTSVASIGQRYIEKYYGQGFDRNQKAWKKPAILNAPDALEGSEA